MHSKQSSNPVGFIDHGVSLYRWLLFIVLTFAWLGLGASPAAAALQLQMTASRTSGVAPLAVYFDNAGTTSSATSYPFTEISYGWDFGDPTSGTFATTGRSKNISRGPAAGHVFEAPGTYTVTLTAQDSQGQPAVQTVQVTVTDPATVYAGTKTICFSTTTDFTGAPAGSQHVTATSLDSLQSYLATGRRLLLHSGQTFTSSTWLDMSGTLGGTIGSYGTGARPIINATGDLVFWGDTDWRVMDLNIQGDGTHSLATTNGSSTQHFLMLRILANNVATAYISSGGDSAMSDILSLADCEFHGSGQGAATIYFGVHRALILGNILRSVSAPLVGTHVVRCWHMDRGIIADNDFADVQSNGHLLKLHAPHNKDANDNGLPWTPAAGYTQQVVILNNLFHGTGGGPTWMVNIAPQNTGFDERLRDLVIEGNFFEAVASNVSAGLNVWSCQNASIRNNIFTSASTAAGSAPLSVGYELQNSIIQRSSHLSVLNNTFYRTKSMDCITVDGADDVAVRNNLGSGFSLRMVVTGSFTALVQDHNQAIVSPGFVSSSPATTADFRLAAGSPAINAGVSQVSAGLIWDFSGLLRDTQPDLGAFEYASSNDNQAPSVPANLLGNATSATMVSLSWDASTDNVGVAGYRIYRAIGAGTPTQIGTSSTLSFTDTTAIASTTYSYTAAAYDAANNVSAQSSPAVSVTTPAPPATVSTPTFSPAAGTYTSAQSVAISSTTSDASIRYTTDGSSPTATTGKVYSTPVTISATTTLKVIAYKTGLPDSTVASATYTINLPVPTAPAITTQPASQTVAAGNPVTFTAAASGMPTPTFQWKKGGVAISGATAASYTIASPALADVGSYTVTATNSAGSATSNAAILSVLVAPYNAIITITVQ